MNHHFYHKQYSDQQVISHNDLIQQINHRLKDVLVFISSLKHTNLRLVQ